MNESTHFYSGIGSRQTPQSVRVTMIRFAKFARAQGWTLRSGGARGADDAFAFGGSPAAQIFLPWEGFNGVQNGLLPGDHWDAVWAGQIAGRYHPRWADLDRPSRLLHARNTPIVLGRDEADVLSRFVICWTADGLASGGTGQALRVAQNYNIPVFNLHDDRAMPAAMAFARSCL